MNDEIDGKDTLEKKGETPLCWAAVEIEPGITCGPPIEYSP